MAYRYIVVDDEQMIRKGILKKMEGVPHDLEFSGEADNGLEALRLIERTDPQIIVTDMRMPDMDGRQLLQRLQTDYPAKKIIVVSGFTDFEYTKEAISAHVAAYLLKPFSKEELAHAMSRAVGMLVEDERRRRLERREAEARLLGCQADLRLIQDLIWNSQEPSTFPELRSDDLRAMADAAQAVAVALLMPEQQADRPQDAAGMTQNAASPHGIAPRTSLTLQTILRMLPIPTDSFRHFAVPHPRNPRAAVLLLASAAGFGRDDFAGWVRPLTSAGWNAGISLPFPFPAGLGDAGQSAFDALLRTPPGAWGCMHQAGLPQDSTAIPDWTEQSVFLFRLETGSADAAADLFDARLDALAARPRATTGLLKRECLRLLDLLRPSAAEAANTPNTALEGWASGRQAGAIVSLFDADELRLAMRRIICNAARLRAPSGGDEDDVVERIRTYVQRFLSQDLTLESIAGAIFLNPSYLSHLFRKKTGMTMTDYVNAARIERACELLRRRETRVSAIPRMLGYESEKYFFRVFKRRMGLTPNEYRQSLDGMGRTGTGQSSEGAGRTGAGQSPEDAGRTCAGQSPEAAGRTGAGLPTPAVP